MSWKSRVTTILGAVLVFALGSSRVAYAAPPRDACTLLTPAQVSAVLGVTVGPGKYTEDPSIPSRDRLDCYWWQSGKSWLEAKRVQLEIAEHFDFDHPLLIGIAKTPASGIGDAAYYLSYANTTDLYVKKGSSVFHVVIGNFPGHQNDQAKTMEKKLAQEAVAKL